MIFGVHLIDNIDKNAFFIENECLAQNALINFSVKLLLAPCAESFDYQCVRIGKERERQCVFVAEILLCLHAVLADADDIVPQCQKLLIVIPQAAGLRSTTRSIGLRIEIYHSLFADKVGR